MLVCITVKNLIKMKDINDMLKQELKATLIRERQEHESFKRDIQNALKEILEENCSEAIDPIKEFCNKLNIPFPTIKIEMELEYCSLVTDGIEYVIQSKGYEFVDSEGYHPDIKNIKLIDND